MPKILFPKYLNKKVEEIESLLYGEEYASIRKVRREENRCEDCGSRLKRQWDGDINVIFYCTNCDI
jgi:formamidopyrimidine-DNA glycosylase